jgi:hypothetical protein
VRVFSRTRYGHAGVGSLKARKQMTWREKCRSEGSGGYGLTGECGVVAGAARVTRLFDVGFIIFCCGPVRSTNRAMPV